MYIIGKKSSKHSKFKNPGEDVHLPRPVSNVGLDLNNY